MDNITIARLLDETAALLEIDGADPFRVRSYRRAAEAVEQQTTQLAALATPKADPKALLAIAGIGKAMASNIRDLVATGTMPLRTELLTRFRPTMLELLRLPGMGPKSVALVWSALQVADIDTLEAAAKAGSLNKLPRMGQKFTAKLLKGIEDHRRNSSRFRVDHAHDFAQRIATLILAFPGIDTVTPAGSLRRGRDTVGDLDLLATGPACEPDVVAAAVDYVATLPLIDKLHARGQNKVTFTLRNNLQVDVRLLPRASYGAALQYFTGSKTHNVALRQRAIKRGLTLSEYALARLPDDGSASVIVAAATEADIYNALELAYIPPELRENCGELEAAALSFQATADRSGGSLTRSDLGDPCAPPSPTVSPSAKVGSQNPSDTTPGPTLPTLITLADIHGDVHMHTSETDGACTIREMAEAAIARGLSYIAITDHSKNLAMTNGMDDRRALAHAARVREVNQDLADEFAAGIGPQWRAYEAQAAAEAKASPAASSSSALAPSPSAAAVPSSALAPSPSAAAIPSSALAPSPSAAAVPSSALAPSPSAAAVPSSALAPSPSAAAVPSSALAPSPSAAAVPSSGLAPSPSAAAVPSSALAPSPSAAAVPSSALAPSPSAAAVPSSALAPSPSAAAVPSSALAFLSVIPEGNLRLEPPPATRQGIALPPHYPDLPIRKPTAPFRIFTGIEVDILAEGQLDLKDETLAQLDIVVASVHSRFDQPEAQMTERILRALENPYTRILGHPTGRKLLRRDPYALNVETIFRRAAELGVAVEHNAAPARADLKDTHLKLAKELGCRISINTDAHATEELDYMHFGITQLRRAWLTPADVLNTQPTPEAFLAALRPRPA